ncbi:MAG: AMP-binding protein [Acidimicrobiales bacterium]|nr:AMP-binding protein [Acidimicrobiales bacterium]
MNIASVIEDHPRDAVAIIANAEKVTYGQLRAQVAQLRGALAQEGVSTGQKVMVVGENEHDFAVALLALLGLGAMVAPIRPRNPLPEIQRKVQAVEPDAIVWCHSAAELRDFEDDLLCGKFLAIDDLESAEAEPAPIADRDADDLAFLLLTSGVTSDSKVAMLSHGNLDWIQQALTHDPETGINADSVALAVLPLTHIFGLNVVLFSNLRAGGTVVLQSQFDVAESFRLIREHGVTAISGAPAMWQRFLHADAPDDALGTIEHAAAGAAALPIEIFNGIRDRFGVELAEGYGLTETSPVVTWSRGITTKPGSVGRPVPGVEVVLVEPDGTPVEQGDSGEIVVRSPGVFKGYLDAPELSETVLTEDGWFWTGDMGVFDADGYLYLVDRLKDIVIVRGFNVYPAEVETVLIEHPNVSGAIVVGTRDEADGERVVAHVSGTATEEELDTHCRERLSRYKCPREYHFVDELPVSNTGKKLRRALR